MDMSFSQICSPNLTHLGRAVHVSLVKMEVRISKVGIQVARYPVTRDRHSAIANLRKQEKCKGRLWGLVGSGTVRRRLP